MDLRASFEAVVLFLLSFQADNAWDKNLVTQKEIKRDKESEMQRAPAGIFLTEDKKLQ